MTTFLISPTFISRPLTLVASNRLSPLAVTQSAQHLFTHKHQVFVNQCLKMLSKKKISNISNFDSE
jgi:hypothetical protein